MASPIAVSTGCWIIGSIVMACTQKIRESCIKKICIGNKIFKMTFENSIYQGHEDVDDGERQVDLDRPLQVRALPP